MAGVAEANAVLAILFFWFLQVFGDHINLLVHFFIFLEDVLLHMVKPWLQVLEQLDHELRILGIHPCVELAFLRPTCWVLLQKLEVYVEQIQEIVEKEVFVYICLDMIG